MPLKESKMAAIGIAPMRNSEGLHDVITGGMYIIERNSLSLLRDNMQSTAWYRVLYLYQLYL